MFCEQAIFTSLKTRRQEGYQLASQSPGITPKLAKELTQWGPAHDALLDSDIAARSMNFHPLDSGEYCVSRTVAAGDEYSGRSGPRIYTQMLIVPADVLQRFANDPFAIIEAADASGQMPVHQHPPPRLEPLRLLGRASLLNQLRVTELAVELGIDLLSNTLRTAITSEVIAVRGQPLERLFHGLLMLVPRQFRTNFSFSTGLRFSARRPQHWLALPNDPAEQRSLERASGAVAIDLVSGAKAAADPPQQGWAFLVRDILHSGRLSLLGDLLRRAERFDPRAHTLDEVAQAVEEELTAGTPSVE